MACFKCHTGDALHGMTRDGTPARRPSATTASRCPPAWTAIPTSRPGKGEIQQHNVHGDKLACQVCHSVENKSCYGCHVQTNDEGAPFYKIEPSVMGFKIGLNPKKSEDRPWNYVVLRHAPIDPENFAFYGKDVLAQLRRAADVEVRHAAQHPAQHAAEQNLRQLSRQRGHLPERERPAALRDRGQQGRDPAAVAAEDGTVARKETSEVA